MMNTAASQLPELDIYEYVVIPYWQTTWFWVTAIIVSILVIGVTAFLVFRYIQRRREEYWRRPWVRALRSLDQIDISKCLMKDDFKKFYQDLTGVVKCYLSARFAWKLIDKTDDEVVDILERVKFEPSLLSSFKTLCQAAREVKFASAQALSSQAEADLVTAYRIVNETIPVDNSSR